MPKLQRLRATRDIFLPGGVYVAKGAEFEFAGDHKYGVPLDQRLPEVAPPRNADLKPAPAAKAAREKATNPAGDNPLV